MDEIRLPCGLVLKEASSGKFVHNKCGVWLSIEPYDGGVFVAWHDNYPSDRVSLAEAISWLNSRVEELVSSLGAVIVPSDARERIERAIVDRRLALGKDDEGLRHEIGGHPHASWVEKEYASAVLSALGMVKP